MNLERVKQLEKWMQDDPSDPFNKYALALEMLHANKNNAAILFTELLDAHSDYLPTYYTAAQFYADLDNKKALSILEKGIELATLHKDAKATKELKALLDQLLFE
jgi:hypothetical protein